MSGTAGAAVFLGAVLAAFHAAFVAFRGIGFLGSGLIGPDSWSRAVRAAELLSQGWWDAGLDRVVPGGLMQHWSRPLDVLLAAGGAALAPVAGGLDEGIMWWAAVLGPMLNIAAACALVGTCAALAGRSGAWMGALVAATQPFAAGQFIPGRVGWHALVIALSLILLLIAVRELTRRGPGMTARMHAAFGALQALAIWTSPETVFAVAATEVAFLAAWASGDVERASFARRGAVRAACAAAACAAAVSLEPAAEWTGVEFQTVSPFFVGCFAFGAVVWAGAAALAVRAPRAVAAWGFLAACGGAFVGAIALAFPDLLSGNYLPSVDRLYVRLRAHAIAETDAVVQIPPADPIPAVIGTWHKLAPFFVGMPALVAAALLVRGSARWACAAPAVLAAGYVCAYGKIPEKGVALMTLLGVIGCAVLLDAVRDRAERRGVHLAGGFTAVGAFFLFGVAGFFAWGPDDGNAAPGGKEAAGSCAGGAVIRAVGRGSGTVLAWADVGPRIMFETGRKVMWIPSHIDQPGFRMAHRAMSSHSFAEARRIMARADVSHVALCDASVRSRFFAAGEPGSVGARLLRGRTPGWAEVVMRVRRGGARTIVVRVDTGGGSEDDPEEDGGRSR